MSKKKLIIAASGASGQPLLFGCLRELKKHPEIETHLILSPSARLTIPAETDYTPADAEILADHIYDASAIGAGPASGSFHADGMLIVPCSMKTLAGIRAGYADNLILRAADVTIKEQRPLVLAARETPFSAIHLGNMLELSRIPGVWIIPPMMSFYQHPSTIDDMIRNITARLLSPFGIEPEGTFHWSGEETGNQREEEK
jgi:4-hydroxy-3-polyprenylbenzoate decarboxylase